MFDKANRLIVTCFLMGSISLPARGLAPPDSESLTMRLELELEDAGVVVMENPILTVRVVNPNAFTVSLPRFNFGYLEPEIIVLRTEQETLRITHGDTSARGAGIVIQPKKSIEIRRFLHYEVVLPRWPVESGLFRLSLRAPVSQARREDTGEWVPIEWEVVEANLRVEPGGLRDIQARDFLERRFALRAESFRVGSFEPSSRVFQITLFQEFLQRFPESVYAPEIRREFTRLFLTLEKMEHRQLEPGDFANQFEECVMYCLDKGSAYAAEILKWEESRANSFVEFAVMNDRVALLCRLIEEIDASHPSDP